MGFPVFDLLNYVVKEFFIQIHTRFIRILTCERSMSLQLKRLNS